MKSPIRRGKKLARISKKKTKDSSARDGISVSSCEAKNKRRKGENEKKTHRGGCSIYSVVITKIPFISVGEQLEGTGINGPFSWAHLLKISSLDSSHFLFRVGLFNLLVKQKKSKYHITDK